MWMVAGIPKDLVVKRDVFIMRWEGIYALHGNISLMIPDINEHKMKHENNYLVAMIISWLKKDCSSTLCGKIHPDIMLYRKC